ncbi:S8 family serine peptidase [Marinobacterium sp. D7]|uniref:S8 family peptidase n=1 Tax=Marinobacterium ramblicola TaxID=2849041 RepID=UPI001C2D0C44|nr:S8 family serine peptidase [Marinobacterium ramblicola]MBV1787213.1 S8 family serine peptidase [Marinobacterium ramblicola]
MHRIRITTLMLLFAFVCFVPSSFAAMPDIAKLDIPRYAPDRVLVKFKPGTAAADITAEHMAANAQLLRTIPQIDVQVMQVPDGRVEASVDAYRRNPNVLYAEPDYYRLLVVPNEEPGPVLITGAANYFEEQWYLHNVGQGHIQKTQDILGNVSLDTVYGTPGADINAPAGWEIETGVAGDLTSYDKPKIAVLDSGADCNIPDLAYKCLEKVSLVGATPGYGNDICPSGDPACDNLGHGTFTAGEAGADTNNTEGLAGAGFDSGVGIFKVCYQEAVTDGIFIYLVGLCPVSGSAEAIILASSDQFDGGTLIRSQYQVITMSYGSDLIDPDTGEIYATDPSTAECEAIQHARDQGVLVVAAAGNNGNTTKVYPAACTDAGGNSTVLSVAASDHEDDRAGFSTYSRNQDDWVSIAAPGQDIIGLQPGSACGIASSSDSCVDWWSGTSMSAPLVAGAAALVWSDLYNRLDAVASKAPANCSYAGMPCNQAVRQRLQDNAAQVGANGQNLLSWTAHGRLDLAAALANDVLPSDGGGGDPGGGDPGTGPVAAFSYDCIGLVCSFTNASQGQGTLSYSWSFGDGAASSDESPGHSYNAAGNYLVRLITTDSGGNAEVSTTLSLKNGKKSSSGSVTSASGSGGGGGSCTHPKNKC